jgi:hypothetical protein
MGLNLNRFTTQEAMNLAPTLFQFEKVVNFDGTGNNGKILAAATLSTNLTGNNNDIVYTAATQGLAGNDITVEYLDTGTPGEALDVTVDETAITVTLEREELVAASLTTALAGSNNDITFTALEEGTDGNDITVTYVDPDAADQTLSVEVTDSDIVVSLATSAATKATGTLTSDATAPSNNDTVTLGAVVYTFKTALTDGIVANEVLIGASAAAALDNLKSAVNLTAGGGTTYGSATVIHPTITATTNTDTTQVFEAKTAGEAGNALASTETSSHLSFGAVTLTGANNGPITTLASEIVTLINYDADAQVLVTAANASSNDGTGVVIALSETSLAGGLDGDIVTTGDEVKAAIAGEAAAAALVGSADKAANDGSGVVTAMAATNLSGGSDGYVDLFTLEEDMLAMVWGSCQEDLAGATATIKLGHTANDDVFLASTTATTIDAGEHWDNTGVLAAEAAPDTTPDIFLTAGTVIRAYVGTATITGGKITCRLVAKRP